jgi:hypothetical protein
MKNEYLHPDVKIDWIEDCPAINSIELQEMWDFDVTLAIYLRSRLQMYMEKTCTDLSWQHWEFEGEEYTMGEALRFIIDACDAYCLDKHATDETYAGYQKALRFLALIIGCIWD